MKASLVLVCVPLTIFMCSQCRRWVESLNLCHWKAGWAPALLEGLNSVLWATKLKARGYWSSEHQFTMLYFIAGRLEVSYYNYHK